MKKYFNRIISLFLVVLMIIPMISAMGLTSSAATYSGTCGNNLKWTLDTSTGVLDITGTGDMYYYYDYYDDVPWYSYRSYVKTVNIGNGVTSIGDYAFYKCAGLTSVTIPDSVTSIGVDAFYNTALYNDNSNWENNVLYIGNHLIKANTSISESYVIKNGTVTIADSAFSSCKSLKFVTIPDSVTSIGESAFEFCTNLTSVTIPDSVTSIGSWAFYKCTGLASVTIPDSVTSIGDHAFYNCSSLTNVTIPDSVTSIGGSAFSDCYGLKSVTIPDSVTSIGDWAFSYCRGLTSVTIPDSVTSIGDKAFYYCNGLTSVTIGNSVTSIGNMAFYNCTGLTSITIPDSVTSIGNRAFYNCTGLTRINVDENNEYYSNDEYEVLYDKDKTILLQYPIGTTRSSYVIPDSVTSIGDYAFYYCTSLTSVTIPDSVTSIGGYAFYNCKSLTIKCYEGSYAETYAKNNSIPVKYICDHVFTNYISDNNYTCLQDGTKTAYCDYGCGATDTKVDEGTILEHKFTDYISDKNGSCIKDGTKTAYCDYGCGTTDTVTDTDYKPHNYTEEIIEESTCTEEGTKLCMCTLCKDFYIDVIPAVEHSGEWIVSAEPTTQTEGIKTFTCIVCGYTETEVIPALGVPEISVNNYDVFVTCADYITYIRYAKGEYTTASEIKNAEGCVTLNASKIASYTKDDVCTLAMPEGGVYSFWLKLKDGTEYIYKVDLSVMTQEVVADGVTVIVKNLYGVKDYFIAKGSHSTYADVKANSVVQITKNKIGTKHDYTYILSTPGTYTVCVRYDDTTRAHEFITFEVTVNEPTFAPNGLQLKVGNLEGIKVIRTAYGEYKTPGEIKRAEGARAFTASTIAKSGDNYTIQYRDEGVVTVAVVYKNGYEVIYKYNVTKKVPLMIQEGSTVTFSNLDDLKVIRYAEGTYTTSNQIKNAAGSKSIQGYKIETESYSVTLAPGTYTFCVQYNDESYNYYLVTI